jgi:hypothetical protein
MGNLDFGKRASARLRAYDSYLWSMSTNLRRNVDVLDHSVGVISPINTESRRHGTVQRMLNARFKND